MVDMLVLDGRDERFRFLGLDGILTATCCPSCVGFLKGPAFNRFSLDGGVEVFPSELFDGAEQTDCYVSPEEYKALTENPFVLGEAPDVYKRQDEGRAYERYCSKGTERPQHSCSGAILGHKCHERSILLLIIVTDSLIKAYHSLLN